MADREQERENEKKVRTLRAYSSLAGTDELDHAVACGTSTLCGALRGADQPAPCAPDAPGCAVVDATRCVYRPEGGAPAVACDAVEQWPDFAFQTLVPWDATFDGFAGRCPAPAEAAGRARGPTE